jgi:hypothetical protein
MIWGKPTPPSDRITVQAQQELSSRGAVKYIYDVDKDGKPDITPTVKLPGNSSVCSQVFKMGSDALNFLRAKGWNLNLWTHFVLIFPGCGTSWGTVGSSFGGGTTWMTFGGAGVLGHELGHNLGFLHAATDWNNDNVADAEYGDGSSVMGATYTGHFAAPNIYAMTKFLGFSLQTPIAFSYANKTSSTFDIYPISLATVPVGGTQILVVTNGTFTYLISTRRNNVGVWERTLPTRFNTGVSVHTFTGGGGVDARSLLVATVAQNASYSPMPGVKITNLLHTANFDRIQVNISPCVFSPPTITVSTTSMCLTKGQPDNGGNLVINGITPACVPTNTYLVCSDWQKPTRKVSILVPNNKTSITIKPSSFLPLFPTNVSESVTLKCFLNTPTGGISVSSPPRIIQYSTAKPTAPIAAPRVQTSSSGADIFMVATPDDYYATTCGAPTSFLLFRSIKGANYSKIYEGTSTRFSETVAVGANVSYYYQVKSFNGDLSPPSPVRTFIMKRYSQFAELIPNDVTATDFVVSSASTFFTSFILISIILTNVF